VTWKRKVGEVRCGVTLNEVRGIEACFAQVNVSGIPLPRIQQMPFCGLGWVRVHCTVLSLIRRTEARQASSVRLRQVSPPEKKDKPHWKEKREV